MGAARDRHRPVRSSPDSRSPGASLRSGRRMISVSLVAVQSERANLETRMNTIICAGRRRTRPGTRAKPFRFLLENLDKRGLREGSIFGSSVTGDTPGYVEFWQKTYAKRHRTMSLTKIEIGGLQPTQGRHVASTMILRYRPNIVIFGSSSPYIDCSATERNIKEHIETVNFLYAFVPRAASAADFFIFRRKILSKGEIGWVISIVCCLRLMACR